MARYLSEHPQVFFSDPKEPHYFNTDFNNRHTTDIDTYNNYFASAGEEHKAIGEASVFYLYSQEAVKNILDYQPDARFIVMLRNPVDMVYSWHSQALQSFGETIHDFESAWRLQSTRQQGQQVPKTCKEIKVLLYGDLCRVGEQLGHLYKLVPKARVLVIFMDDMKVDMKRVYDQVLSFLEVEPDNRIDFEIYNPNRKLRSPLLKVILDTGFRIKKYLGIRHGVGLMSAVHRANITNDPRSPMPPELHTELATYFNEDIKLVSSLTGRDLSSWLKL